MPILIHQSCRNYFIHLQKYFFLFLKLSQVQWHIPLKIGRVDQASQLLWRSQLGMLLSLNILDFHMLPLGSFCSYHSKGMAFCLFLRGYSRFSRTNCKWQARCDSDRQVLHIPCTFPSIFDKYCIKVQLYVIIVMCLFNYWLWNCIMLQNSSSNSKGKRGRSFEYLSRQNTNLIVYYAWGTP